MRPKTRTLAAGSEARASRGFTLVELLVVLVLIALASGLAGLALRQSDASRLEREALRLAALLEAARAEARATGVAVRFELATAPDAPAPFRFVGLAPSQALPERWLEAGTQARIDATPAVLLLGPEPMIGTQRVVLSLGEQQLTVATDGLAPFSPLATSDGAAGGLATAARP